MYCEIFTDRGFSISTRDEDVPLKSWLFVRYSTDPSNFKWFLNQIFLNMRFENVVFTLADMTPSSLLHDPLYCSLCVRIGAPFHQGNSVGP